MSYQLSDLITKVQNKIKDTGFSTSTITDCINDAQWDVFNEYDLRFQEQTQNYTLIAGVSDITAGNGLPADFINAIDLTNTTTSYERNIAYKDFREIDEFVPNPDDAVLYPQNVPIFWYMFAGTIHVWPRPDKAYTLLLRYKRRPTELTSNTDVPLLPQEFRELLVIGAAYRIFEIKDDFVQASYLKSRYDELAMKLVQRYSRKQNGSPSIMRINRYAKSS